ncbi:unnamed protein product [Diplocarpon coronariae]
MVGNSHSISPADIPGKICEDCERIYRKNKRTDLARSLSSSQRRNSMPYPQKSASPITANKICPNYAQPGQGIDYCDDHKCPDIACRSVKKRYELGETLKWAVFCRDHECQTPSCEAKKLQGKNHCQSHCCNMKSCTSALFPRLPIRFCLAHYEKLVAQRAASQREAELHAEQQARELREAKKREQQQKEDEKLARQLENEEKEERYLWYQQEALVRAQEIEKARLEGEIRERWQAERAERARLEAEVECKAPVERADHGSERHRRKSTRNSCESFHSGAETGASMGERFETSLGSHYSENSKEEKMRYQGSPHGSESYCEVHQVSMPRPKGGEQPRMGNYMHIHHDDEAFQSAGPYYMRSETERGAEHVCVARDRYRRRGKQYSKPNGTAYFYSHQSEAQETVARSGKTAVEEKQNSRDGW